MDFGTGSAGAVREGGVGVEVEGARQCGREPGRTLGKVTVKNKINWNNVWEGISKEGHAAGISGAPHHQKEETNIQQMVNMVMYSPASGYDSCLLLKSGA